MTHTQFLGLAGSVLLAASPVNANPLDAEDGVPIDVQLDLESLVEDGRMVATQNLAGSILMAWEAADANGRTQIFMARFDDLQDPIVPSATQQVSVHGGTRPALATHGDDVLIAYVKTHDDGDPSLHSQFFSAPAGAPVLQRQVNESRIASHLGGMDADWRPSAIRAGDEWLVSYVATMGQAGQAAMIGFKQAGAGWQTAPLAAHTPGPHYHQHLAPTLRNLSDGRTVATWLTDESSALGNPSTSMRVHVGTIGPREPAQGNGGPPQGLPSWLADNALVQNPVVVVGVFVTNRGDQPRLVGAEDDLRVVFPVATGANYDTLYSRRLDPETLEPIFASVSSLSGASAGHRPQGVTGSLGTYISWAGSVAAQDTDTIRARIIRPDGVAVGNPTVESGLRFEVGVCAGHDSGRSVATFQVAEADAAADLAGAWLSFCTDANAPRGLSAWLHVIDEDTYCGVGLAAGDLGPDCLGGQEAQANVAEDDCSVAQDTPWCSDSACALAVCEYDSYCCDVAWDGICAAEAATDPVCSPTDGPTSVCPTAATEPGCTDTTCQACVCDVDPYCCDVAWDGICVAEAAANSTVGCADACAP